MGIYTFALLFCCPAPASAYRLPDSDQRKCYRDVSPYDEIPCAGTGQDGAYIQNPLSYTVNGDEVTDNNPGLIWQREDDGNTYNWYQATGTSDSYYNPIGINACGSFGRLPSKKELTSIVDYAIPYPWPTINPVFTNTKASVYWSSTSYASLPYGAWGVDFDNGVVLASDKDNAFYVRCVRGGQSGSFGNLNPTIAMTPMAAPAGTTFAEWGAGFTPNSTATLHFFNPAGEEILPAVTQPLDAIGHFDKSYLSPPEKPEGPYTWYAIDNISSKKSNTVTYQITAPAGQRGLYFTPDQSDFGVGAPGSSATRYMQLYNDSALEIEVDHLALEDSDGDDDISQGRILFNYTVNGKALLEPFRIPQHASVSVGVILHFYDEPSDGTYDAVVTAVETNASSTPARAYLTARIGLAANLEVKLFRGGELIRNIAGRAGQGYHGVQGKIAEQTIYPLTQNATPAKGVVADGNARLFVVAESNVSGLVEFINPDPYGDGRDYLLEPLAQTGGGAKTTVHTVEVALGVHQATAVLIAPEDYPEPDKSGTATAGIKINLYSDSTEVPSQTLHRALQSAARR